MSYRYYTADVFTNEVFQGAQIAVFPDAAHFDERLMARIAKELNLSETVFVSPAQTSNCFRLQVFSPKGEVAFAGHPILAAAKVLVRCGQINPTCDKVVVFQQNSTSVAVDICQREARPLFVQFELSAEASIDRYTPTAAELAHFLNIQEREIDTHRFHTRLVSINRPYLIVPLISQDAVRRARFSMDAWSQSSAPAMAAQEIFIFSARTEHRETDFHARLLGPDIGANEDPPIGSVMPCFAAYLGEHEHVREGTHTFTIDRGTTATRRSVLNIEADYHPNKPVKVRVGGEVVLVSESQLLLETP